MRRSIHTAITLFAVLLLLKPFDCFANGQFTREAADCCKKGKCIPSSNADDCCKHTLPGDKQLVVSKAPHHAPLTVDSTTIIVCIVNAPTVTVAALAEALSLPGSPPGLSSNLPLLI